MLRAARGVECHVTAVGTWSWFAAALCLFVAGAAPALAGTFGNKHVLVIGIDGVRPDALLFRVVRP